METVGDVIRARRKLLGLSQEHLAWLSGVSRTTIRNIEADRVEEARTWDQVEQALGWDAGSLGRIRRGEAPRSLLDEEAQKIILRVLLRRYDRATETEHILESLRFDFKASDDRLAELRDRPLGSAPEVAALLEKEERVRLALMRHMGMAERDMKTLYRDLNSLLSVYQRALILASKASRVSNGSGLEEEGRRGAAALTVRELMSQLMGELSTMLERMTVISAFGDSLRVDDLEKRLVEGSHYVDTWNQEPTRRRTRAPKWDLVEPDRFDGPSPRNQDEPVDHQSRRGVKIFLDSTEGLTNIANVPLLSSFQLPVTPRTHLVALLFTENTSDRWSVEKVDRDDIRLFFEITDLIEEHVKKKRKAIESTDKDD